ncbi:MAG: SGNH/GDSL hydrolase family protein [Lachnospiraceae bacterium]
MKKTIVCFGDSNTHGYCSANNGRFSEEERWPCLLEQYLGEQYHVLEEGLSGRTTVFDDPLYEGLSGLSFLFPCLMTHEPVDLLILMLGTNDVKARFAANASNIAKGLERLVQKAITTDAWRDKPRILIITPAPIDAAYETTMVCGEMGQGCAEKSQELAPFYQEVAERLGCLYLDAGSIDGIRMHPNDYMHLDQESHRLLAKRLADLISTQL